MGGNKSLIRPKNASTLLLWLEKDISRHLDHRVKAFAHGGTALTLLNIKDSTKDVDFTFIDKDEFYSIVGVLKTMNYNPTRDFKTG